MMDFQTNGPLETAKGDPWVRWGKREGYSGWYFPGTFCQIDDAIPDTEEYSFWKRLYLSCCHLTEGKLDSVHCIGPGVLYVGGAALTLSSGRAQRLFNRLLWDNPRVFMEQFGILAYEKDYCFNSLVAKEFSDSFLSGTIVRDRSDGKHWTSGQKDWARRWVSAVSKILRRAPLSMQAGVLSEIIREELSDEDKSHLRWSERELERLDIWTLEQQKVWMAAFLGYLLFGTDVKTYLGSATEILSDQVFQPVRQAVEAQF